MSDNSRFGAYYERAADDELARIALSDELLPEARQELNAELAKRRLTDLSEYKRALAVATEWKSPARQMEFQGALQRKFHGWALVFAAWIFAAALPIIWNASPTRADSLKVGAGGALFIALSCYLGIRAGRQGSRSGFILKLVVPLFLIGCSSVAVLTGVFPKYMH
jgi:hypothetical protein